MVTKFMMRDGKVLVTGGCCFSNSNSAEVYSPDTGTWSSTGGMAVDRAFYAATLLPDGKVLITGGWTAKRLLP